MKKNNATSLDWSNWLVILIILGGLSYSLYQGYLALQIDEKEVAARTMSVSQNKAQTSAAPSLTLNNPHHRQGEAIVVDPNNIGKSNPFTR